jgi:chromosome segregation ATPase
VIEAAMLIALGFLAATLLALAALPALARRADRLARKRAEAAFPLSLAEIAADRDHLRAELALRERALEKRAESGFAARADAMEELGRRDMTIGRLERERDARVAELEGGLTAACADLAKMRDAHAAENAALAQANLAIEQRVKDVTALEHSLDEARAALAQGAAELAQSRSETDAQRIAQVESQTQLLVLQGKQDDLDDALAASKHALDQVSAGLRAMTADRDSERLRADGLAARAAQAEAGLAAADSRNTEMTAEIARREGDEKPARPARKRAENGPGRAGPFARREAAE